MATFVSLATCHHCPINASRHGLIYTDSLSVLSRNLTGPGSLYVPHSPRLKDVHRPTRPNLPEPVLQSCSKSSSSMRHLVVAHLRRFLTLSPAHRWRRGLQLPG